MKNSVYPCLWFDNQAQEAAKFYKEAFQYAEIKASNPVVVTINIKGKQFILLNGGPVFKPNASISFFNICESLAEVEELWRKLSEGGKVMMPLDTYPWSDKYGWVQDKYGVSWQLSLGKPGEKADLFPSLLFTGAQNGQAEKAINFYTSLFENSSIEMIARYEAGDHDKEGNVKYGEFYLDGSRMTAMESSMDHHFTFNEGVSLVVECDTQEDIDFYWLNLTEDGMEGRCGWCRDAFGVWWQIIPSILVSLMNDPEKAINVTEAFMQMNKFDIEAIKQAAA
ncbi:VOC family protein [Pedobacter sp.]|uniref:VOC family protein n=1 Tax=Pedobacter sp. TaxID=1411316 RepID=UPI003D7FCB4A